MKKLLLPTLLATCAIFSAQAQEKLSGHLYTGWLFPQNDFIHSDYEGNKPNLAVGAGIGYQIAPALTLRGDFMAGNMDGNHEIYYYETSLYEAKLGLDFNVIKLFNKDYEKIKLNLHVAPGMMYYSAKMYDIDTREKLVESPVAGEKALSPNFILAYGGSVGIALSPKLDLNLGYSNRFVDEVEWMDANQSGDYSDYYGMAQVGFTYYLKNDPSKVQVDKKAYADLNKKVANLEQTVSESEANGERIAELEMSNQEKAMRIQTLEAELDSAKTNFSTQMATTTVETEPQTPANAEAILGEPQFRIIVASLPNRVMAQRWIDRSNLDKSGMVVAYIENLNTYRVVYKSFPSFAAARKELLNIKGSIPDAWIVEF
ncbi:hypothetical protein [Owenweeksia hongkongensis]|uniref:SPOR domain-containing protein n=1 Tax=Owenweeksia hongkongensis TaxID=253245 RepID=UPI003A9404EC